MPHTIHIAAGDYTSSLVKRRLGWINAGFYCDNCGEFVAMTVTAPKNEHKVRDVQFACDGPIQFSCPFCQHSQKRIVSEIHHMMLTEGNKRKHRSTSPNP
jgi:hypothetical protein